MENNRKISVLRRHSEFTELSKRGSKIQGARWLVLNYKKNELGHPRFGWTIPRQVGGAVIRNRLRRWCREITRKNLENFGSFDVNVFLRPVDAVFYKQIQYEDFKSALQKAYAALYQRR